MNIMLLIPVLSGWMAGYIVNYCGDVLPFTRRFSQPVCRNCGTVQPWKEYLLFQNCGACGEQRSPRSFIVQLIFVITTVYLWVDTPSRLGFYLAFVISIYLGIVFLIDFEHRLIMHPVSIVGAILAFGTGVYVHGLVPTLIGGAVGFGSMLAFYFLGEVFARYMSKRRNQEVDEVALGFGDVNLSGIAGLFLGWPVILAGLLFTIFAGGAGSLIVIAVMLIRKRYQAFTPIPYAPFLILSIIFYLFR
jgi:prepilin signal peptidase PulO-like enzyme (type II secretory pathway)